MKKCIYCGSSVDDSEDTCPNCGGKVVDPAKTQEQIDAENKRAEETAEFNRNYQKKNNIYGIVAMVLFFVIFFGAVIGIIVATKL